MPGDLYFVLEYRGRKTIACRISETTNENLEEMLY